MTDQIANNELRVQEWNNYIGQEAMKKRLNTFIQAAIAGRRMLPHVLLAAGPGYGKTTLAQIIARRLNDDFRMLTMPVKANVLEHLLRNWHGGVLLLDEIHSAPKAQQEALMPLLDEGYLQLADGRRLQHRAITIIGATTEPEKILPPLTSKFKIRPVFEPYSDEELTQIVRNMGLRIGLEMSDWVVEALGRATGGTPRHAEDFILAARALHETSREVTVDAILELCAIDHDGLTAEHVIYLNALKELGGTSGVDKIANMTRMHLHTVQNLERLLVRRGFITFTPGGRELTPEGSTRIGYESNKGDFRKVVA